MGKNSLQLKSGPVKEAIVLKGRYELAVSRFELFMRNATPEKSQVWNVVDQALRSSVFSDTIGEQNMKDSIRGLTTGGSIRFPPFQTILDKKSTDNTDFPGFEEFVKQAGLTGLLKTIRGYDESTEVSSMPDDSDPGAGAGGETYHSFGTALRGYRSLMELMAKDLRDKLATWDTDAYLNKLTSLSNPGGAGLPNDHFWRDFAENYDYVQQVQILHRLTQGLLETTMGKIIMLELAEGRYATVGGSSNARFRLADVFRYGTQESKNNGADGLWVSDGTTKQGTLLKKSGNYYKIQGAGGTVDTLTKLGAKSSMAALLAFRNGDIDESTARQDTAAVAAPFVNGSAFRKRINDNLSGGRTVNSDDYLERIRDDKSTVMSWADFATTFGYGVLTKFQPVGGNILSAYGVNTGRWAPLQQGVPSGIPRAANAGVQTLAFLNFGLAVVDLVMAAIELTTSPGSIDGSTFGMRVLQDSVNVYASLRYTGAGRTLASGWNDILNLNFGATYAKSGMLAPVFGAVTNGLAILISIDNATDSYQKGDISVTVGSTMGAMGAFALMLWEMGGVSFVSNPVLLGVGLALTAVGSTIVYYTSDAAITTWVDHTYFGTYWGISGGTPSTGKLGTSADYYRTDPRLYDLKERRGRREYYRNQLLTLQKRKYGFGVHDVNLTVVGNQEYQLSVRMGDLSECRDGSLFRLVPVVPDEVAPLEHGPFTPIEIDGTRMRRTPAIATVEVKDSRPWKPGYVKQSRSMSSTWYMKRDETDYNGGSDSRFAANYGSMQGFQLQTYRNSFESDTVQSTSVEVPPGRTKPAPKDRPDSDRHEKNYQDTISKYEIQVETRGVIGSRQQKLDGFFWLTEEELRKKPVYLEVQHYPPEQAAQMTNRLEFVRTVTDKDPDRVTEAKEMVDSPPKKMPKDAATEILLEAWVDNYRGHGPVAAYNEVNINI